MKKELWKRQLENYDELINKYHWKQEPMLALINELQANGISEKFFPSNSHEALGLSRFKEYPLRTEYNMVFIVYSQKNSKFEIEYFRKEKILIKTVTEKVTEKDIRKIEYWLQMI